MWLSCFYLWVMCWVYRNFWNSLVLNYWNVITHHELLKPLLVIEVVVIAGPWLGMCGVGMGNREPVPNSLIYCNRMHPSLSVPFIDASMFLWQLHVSRQWRQTHTSMLLRTSNMEESWRRGRTVPKSVFMKEDTSYNMYSYNIISCEDGNTRNVLKYLSRQYGLKLQECYTFDSTHKYHCFLT